MRLRILRACVCVTAWVGSAVLNAEAAAPAAPTSLGPERAIDLAQSNWTRPGATPKVNAPGWDTFFAALKADLKTYARPNDGDEQLRALGRIYEMSQALAPVAWAPAQTVREELRAWLRPRVALAWAQRRLVESVRGLPPSVSPQAEANRRQWVRFVEEQVASALRSYEAAGTVAERQEALGRLHAALEELRNGNRSRAWGPAISLETALDDLFGRPNVAVAADLATVAPAFENNLVTDGPVYRKGQISYVKAGAKTGFGLLPSDDGIAFYNRQLLSSTTPVRGFQQQIASDPQGRRIAGLYNFGMTTFDSSELTVIGIIRPSGLQLLSDASHAPDAVVTSAKTHGKFLARLVLNVIGMNQRKITQKVYEGAVAEIRQQVPREATEERTERMAKAEAEQNVKLRSVLVGNNTAVYGPLALTELSLRSQPDGVRAGGLAQWRDGPSQAGADAPRPLHLGAPSPGVSADVHLASLLTNLSRGAIVSPTAAPVSSVLIVARPVPPGGSPRDAFQVRTNADFDTLLKTMDELKGEPKATAIRIQKPPKAPEFAADANGRLVILWHDAALEVPVPEAASSGLAGRLLGSSARVYRIEAPRIEVAITFKVESADSAADRPMRVVGQISGFEFAPGTKVLGIRDASTPASPLNAIATLGVLTAFTARVQGQPLDVPLTSVSLPGFAIRSVSSLDPTGWIRVVLEPTPRAEADVRSRVSPAPPGQPAVGPASTH